MTTDVLGAPIKRVEDPRFITGKGRYLDDISMPGITYMAIVRSPYAHANIKSVDTTAATPSPVHLTLSVARTRGVLTLFWMPALPPAGQAIGSGLYGMSAPTKTPTTPGISLAALVSTDRMLAWA